MIQYQVLLVIESVEINDETGDNVPDSRQEEDHEVIKCVTSEASAYGIVNAMMVLKDTVEKVYPWLSKE